MDQAQVDVVIDSCVDLATAGYKMYFEPDAEKKVQLLGIWYERLNLS